ncbi:putative bifunctional diguanylate cyclase/phosphodiesterase [Methylorubrum extorquens]|uniref:Bifunctional diguanylate cyclase/phosphodiesterase n=1 Tax=Methylorubrum extorquens TaxID=408 RepID=A0AAX3WE54_METEX|nr:MULTISPECIES: bifunctional diguanylate cyclase/phosphodiesterase [Methylobacteriaceae]KQQ12863.1 diguanylate cyclase [Methylobacterium sp. Leaf122]WHQ69607.1 bifunctional diguanylate cyclase/phosphodiesterase [Methylorubrum extorquens]
MPEPDEGPTVTASPERDERIRRLERRVARERSARAEAESLLEAKSRELYALNQQLSRFAADLELRVDERTRELALARERAVALAERDQLTGLANRTRFARVLGAAVGRAGRGTGNERFALLLLDLDRFKEINDSLGHEAGDVFLQHVARRLSGVAGQGAVTARLGGDEFAAIVPLGPRSDLARLGEAVVAEIRRPVAYRGRMLEASASLGIAVFPDDAATGSDLQRFADIALYRSKATRAAWTRFDPRMGREIEERQALGADLGAAIRSGAIEPWFQPIVDGVTRHPVGAEALARWVHPQLGLLAPAGFLGLAEERGLMRDLFAGMMRRACPPARDWVRAGAIRTLSVNLSPSQFKLGSVADDVIALLTELDFPPEALTVEITEEVLLNDLDRARVQLERLAAHGVRIALDDFGVGYSNIAYLRRLPIQTLKLDRLLTVDVAQEHEARCILGAIVQIARALDLRLVAEGVEDPGQALWLSHLGCRHLQGYLFGRPMPAEAFAGYLGFDGARRIA